MPGLVFERAQAGTGDSFGKRPGQRQGNEVVIGLEVHQSWYADSWQEFRYVCFRERIHEVARSHVGHAVTAEQIQAREERV